MKEFSYARAKSLEEASATFTGAREARYLSGGQTLIPVLKQRLASPTDLIDLAGVPSLDGITATAQSISIGGMTTHATVAGHPGVQSAIPALAELAGGIGDPHVRNRGTIGGSLANNDPAADYPAAVLGLGATVKTNKRQIAADDFFAGLFTTALEEGEILTGVEFAVPKRAGYVKFPHPASRFCLVAVMVSDGPQGVRVAVTGAGQEGVFRVAAMEAALANSFTPAALEGIKVSADNLLSDIHAQPDYRAHLIGVLAKRAVAKAIG
jgi:aerobic carbon-monoxide dehydrogenase medium subunit